ncbi:MAG: glycine dehydrogenase (aminomethyl-transferring), partial [Phaeodactylibacter sp.]|nr:glycine dehydrogenase (aminomethyl-transferring) [Phaeodactylibacter sp.]
MNKTAPFDRFINRHIGINEEELQEMLSAIGVKSLDQLIDETVPPAIRMNRELDLPEAMTEYEYLEELRQAAALNKVYRSYIGMGYSGAVTPSVILRNVFQNPGWYTQYTPYQAEISQGRLEALLNFQTMVSDLTALPIANASLLDEATAAAEAMHMFYGIKNKRAKGEAINQFLVSDKVLPQTIDVLKTRANPLDIEVVIGDWRSFEFTDKTFGLLLQYPDREGSVEDYRALVEKARAQEIYVTVAADLLSLALLTPPGEWGADAVVGNSQRFGVPMGYGGPHAAFFATREEHKRQIPGRIIGVSVDAYGKKAYRMALQTREQHIRREKATSNICTAQALLAVMASMYAVYHGPKGIRAIAERTHTLAQILDQQLKGLGFNQVNAHYFDTLRLEMDGKMVEEVRRVALAHETNFFYEANAVQVSLDETVGMEQLKAILSIFAEAKGARFSLNGAEPAGYQLPEALQRQTPYLEHLIFNSFHTETKMMRYIKQLENKDLSLMHSMIPLGSCT